MPLEDFILLAPSIVPGIDQKGLSTMSPLPSKWLADVIAPNNDSFFIRVKASKDLINTLFPTRHLDESLKRSRIYIESLVRLENGVEKYYVVIGHAAYPLPEAIKNGSLDWLRSFESGTADIYYLGDLTEYNEDFINKRHEFFYKKGFLSCAESYASFLSQSDTKERVVDLKYLNTAINLPLIEYSDAWNSYIEQQLQVDADPPGWFYKGFLVPLGFDRMVMDIPEVQ